MRELVEKILDRVRPQLRGDGADIELLDVTADGVVKLGLKGGCTGCPFSQMALAAGLEGALRQEVAGVSRVEIVRVAKGAATAPSSS